MEMVWNFFIGLVREYDMLSITEEEAREVFQDNVVIALPSIQLKGMLEDVEITDGEFSRKLTSTESLVLSYACVVTWLSPYVYSSELLSAQLTSTDFSQFSGNLRLQVYIKLFNEADTRLNQAILDYDTRLEYASIRKEVKKRG